jgi:hypothetical protein
VPALVFLLPLIASAVNDKVVHGRVHPVSWLAPLCLVGFNVGRGAFVRNTTSWHEFVRWVVG